MKFDYGEYQELVNSKLSQLYKIAKKILADHELKKVRLAYEVAATYHFKQNRKSGEPYIIHPIEVATIIANWDLDCATICSALLHDVVEDTQITKEDIGQIFGVEIAELVDSVTKLDKINFESEEIAHAEYFRKMVLAMARDIRVILIKLADRLHNVLTLSSMKPEKQHKIALETMEVYVPIANKIGLHRVHLQLAEESFKYLHPLRYKILKKAIAIAQEKRTVVVDSILHTIKGSMKSNGVNANFIARQRSTYNIYRRMARRNLSFDRIYDIFEVKIIVATIRECYLTLGVLHSLYQPLPGKFKDYIAIPKSNGYQSLHSTLMGPHGIPLQIHIRTETMEDVAENGIICHWLKNKHDDAFLSANKRTVSWINNILDIQASTFSANEFLSNIKQDLSPVDIYVFTPKGKIVILPKGSTPLDFAYFIHSDIGNHCHQAKINSKLSKLNTTLQNGDIIEIITDNNVEPIPEWLEIANSGKALSRIKQYFKEQKYDEDIINGERLVKIYIQALDYPKTDSNNLSGLSKIAYKYYNDMPVDELKHQIGTATLSALNVAKQLVSLDITKPIEIKLSNCKHFSIIQDENCLALPGSTCLAKVTRNGDLIIHRPECKQNKISGLDNLAFVHIINDVKRLFLAKVRVNLSDIPGTFTKFSGIIAAMNINIVELTQEVSSAEYATVSATLGVFDIQQIEDLFDALNKSDVVNKAYLI